MKKQDLLSGNPRSVCAYSGRFLAGMRSRTKGIEAMCLPGKDTNRGELDHAVRRMRMYGSVVEDV